MDRMEIKEVKGAEIKKSKYKFYIKNKLLIKSLKFALFFAISMVLIRIITLWALKVESVLTFKEVLSNHYYYTSDKISLFDHMENLLVKSIAPDILMRGINGEFNIIIKGICYIIGFVFGLPLSFILLASIPFLYMNMNLISIVDNIVPSNGSVLIWWFIYFLIFGFIIGLFRSLGIKKNNIENEEQLNVNIRKFNGSVLGVILFLQVASLFGVKYFGGEYNNKFENSYNIKKLVKTSIIDDSFASMSSEDILYTLDDVYTYSKERTSVFSNILTENGMSSDITSSGLVAKNTYTKYEKYSNKYSVNMLYKVQPDFEKGRLDEGFYIYYEYPDVESLDETYISVISSLINNLTNVPMEYNTVLDSIQTAIDKDKTSTKEYKEDNVKIKTAPNYIAVSYKGVKPVAKITEGSFVVEDGMIVEPAIHIDTVDEYKNNIRGRWENIFNIAKADTMVQTPLLNNFKAYEISIENQFIYKTAGVDKQFSDYLSIVVDTDDLAEDINYVCGNEIYDIITEFSGIDIGTREAFSNYIYGMLRTEMVSRNVIDKDDSFFKELPQFKHPMIGSEIISINISDDYFIIRVEMPVVAEGKGYI